jgi:hypothetical protein
MDTLITIAMKFLGLKELEPMITTTKVAQVDDKQQVLLQQHEIVTEAARKLLDVAEKMFSDFENAPSWEDVDKYWKAIELAEHVTRNL